MCVSLGGNSVCYAAPRADPAQRSPRFVADVTGLQALAPALYRCHGMILCSVAFSVAARRWAGCRTRPTTATTGTTTDVTVSGDGGGGGFCSVFSLQLTGGIAL